MEFEIKREEEGPNGAYFIEDNGQRIGEMTYHKRPVKYSSSTQGWSERMHVTA